MQRITAFFLIAVLCISLCGCGVQFLKPVPVPPRPQEVKRFDDDTLVAFLSTAEGIEDRELNQTLHTVCSSFCGAYSIFYSYYILPDNSPATIEDYIDGIVQDGYRIIILPGIDFAESITWAAEKYSDVLFLGVDISEKDLNDRYQIPKNLCCISFREDIAGFLAGYAAVAMGYRYLGFFGGSSDSGVRRYGSGFVQGASLAASQREASVLIEYAYAGGGEPESYIKDRLSSWYSELGVELVFAAGRGTIVPVALAAAESGGKLMAADFNSFSRIESYGSGICVSCAEKNYDAALSLVLADVLLRGEQEKHEGRLEVYGLVGLEDMKDNYVQLSHSTRWTESFGAEEYTALVGSLLANDIKIYSVFEPASDDYVTINYMDGIM